MFRSVLVKVDTGLLLLLLLLVLWCAGWPVCWQASVCGWEVPVESEGSRLRIRAVLVCQWRVARRSRLKWTSSVARGWCRWRHAAP